MNFDSINSLKHYNVLTKLNSRWVTVVEVPEDPMELQAKLNLIWGHL